MKILFLLLLDFGLKIFGLRIFFLLPLLLVYFFQEKKEFWPLLFFFSLIEDIFAFAPLGFFLFLISASFLILASARRFLKLDGLVGLISAFALVLFILTGGLAWSAGVFSLHYLLIFYIFNLIYAVAFLLIYSWRRPDLIEPRF
ncbi:MAG: hypothetical protein M1505_00045 [Patescibacteria group bacterium]|nr:hypothetical protein [Patescibacteria group bacterium]